MRKQKLQLISANSLYERSFLQTVGNGKDEVRKKCSYEGLNFVCSNLADAYSVDFTYHP